MSEAHQAPARATGSRPEPRRHKPYQFMGGSQFARAETERNHPIPKDLAEQFREVLSRHPRVAIAGGPNTGKSTLASLATDRELISTDDWLPEAPGRPAGKRWNPALDWSAVSADVVRVCGELTSFVVEGVRVAHALRKGLEVDAVIVLTVPHLPLTSGQESQRKATETVLRDWLSNAGRMPALFQFTGA